MIIRRAEVRDALAISATLRAAFTRFEPLYTPAGFRVATPSPEEIAERFTEGPIWIAELDGKVIGTVSAVSQGSDLYIRSMAVHPSAGGAGVGARLLDAVEAFAVNQYRKLLLNTRPFLLEAMNLYERRGFRYAGEVPDPYGTPLFAMAKDLGNGR
jgi:ribosomal protein S18 acetylase RimI-like enzyme